MKYHLTYLSEGQERTLQFQNTTENEDLSVRVEKKENGMYVSSSAKKEVTLKKLSVSFPSSFQDSRVFLNGYQSWTDSRELTKNDTMPGLLHLPKALVRKYAFDGYGDYRFTEYRKTKGFFHGFTYGYIRKDKQWTLIASLDESVGYTVLYFDLNKGEIRIEKDCDGHKLSQDEVLLNVRTYLGNKERVFDAWFEEMGVQPLTHQTMTGYTSWYNYYQDINEEKIQKNLEEVKADAFSYDLFQIDDGYEQFVGDWLTVDPIKFPNGLATIAQDIVNSGMEAGIWLAPFVCEKKSRLYREHPDWIVKDENGQELLCGNNWSYFVPLDLYHPDVRKYLREVFAYYRSLGFTFFKLDFLYGVCMIPRNGKSRSEIMNDGMAFLRECIGDCKLLGCGVPLANCFGKVEYMRIGCDVSLDWDNTWWWRLLHRERTGTKPSLCNTLYRQPLDHRAFLNDPDVFLLRKGIQLNSEQKKTLLFADMLCGSFWLTSDGVASYDEETKALFEQALRLKERTDLEIIQEGNQIIIFYELDGKAESLAFDLSNGHILELNLR